MLSEFDLIARYFSPPTDHTLLAGGDDAALLVPSPGMSLAVSTDMLVAGRHFFEDADAYAVGCKALAVNLSDMAAMGAVPRWATLSLALPAANEPWLDGFARGFLSLAQRYRVDLIGGDTTRGSLNICVQIMGEVREHEALLRSGARVGDDIWVSGTLGDAALALAHLCGEIKLQPDEVERVRARLDFPEPRVRLGQALRGLAHSAIDLSDGLVADVGHVAWRSGVRAVIESSAVPLSAVALRYRELPLVIRCALAGGDDYELCFTVSRERRGEVARLADALALPLARVGWVESGRGVVVKDRDGMPLVLEKGGFDHFGDPHAS